MQLQNGIISKEEHQKLIQSKPSMLLYQKLFQSFSEKEENIESINFDHTLRGIDIKYDTSNVDESMLQYFGVVITRLKEKRVSNLIAFKSEENHSAKKVIDPLILQVSNPKQKGNFLKNTTS